MRRWKPWVGCKVVDSAWVERGDNGERDGKKVKRSHKEYTMFFGVGGSVAERKGGGWVLWWRVVVRLWV
jgi:hypothetical protein